MATPKARIMALINAIVPDIRFLKSGVGTPASLNTVSKQVVGAINELEAEINSLVATGAGINDTAGDGATTSTWSANKIFDEIAAAKAAVKNDLLNGAGAAYDTFKELQDLFSTQNDSLTNLTTAVGNTVRFTSQPVALTDPQKTQARSNINAASQTEFAVTQTQVNDLDYDFAAEYVSLRDA